MKVCAKCGQTVEFRFIDGRPIPLHFEGGCSADQRTAASERVRRSDESSCVRTKCPKCSDAVFFIRHNGGSVWIDPPLGPPWYRHGCMDGDGSASQVGKRQRKSIVDAGLLEALGEREGIFTGVVTISEISDDRRRTLLTVEVGEADDLVVLVKGGADSFVGKIVIVDGPKRIIFCADAPRFAFTILNTVSVPQSLAEAGIDLPEMLGPSQAKKLRSAMEPEGTGAPNDKQRQLMARYRSGGLDENWKLPKLLQLVDVLKGSEKDRAAHIAAIMILEKAEKHGDCSHAAELARLLSPARQTDLRAWFARFSPVSIDIARPPFKARFFRPANGERKSFDIAGARRTPFYQLASR